jgi:hypothetical protein
MSFLLFSIDADKVIQPMLAALFWELHRINGLLIHDKHL